MSKSILLEISDDENSFKFNSTIQDALEQAYLEIDSINETVDSVKILKPECDKLDYSLAVGSGALCGILDIFLVGKPGESILGNFTDKWVENRTKDFAKMCGWDGENSKSAIRFLEETFKVPYDQRGAGDAGQSIFGLNPMNHHFKSLAHNPSLLGLFFSILDQFTNQSHFVTEGDVISLQSANDSFTLRGNNIPSKLFCAFVNWFGHLMSDVSGSSGSTGRGMGIPSPLWTWTNDIISIKSKFNIPSSDLDKSINELALKMYNSGYDARFQATQVIPVLINELVVRFFYATRRAVKYFVETDKQNRSFEKLWEMCEPFSNATVKRMLTVAHGTFCLIDVGDATIRSFVTGAGTFNPVEFFMRVNIVGVGRFTISIYGEIKRGTKNINNQRIIYQLNREKEIVEYYIEELKIFNNLYDDQYLMSFINDFSNSQKYMDIFNASVELAKKRNVPEDKILYSKLDGDNYFRGITK